MIEQPEATEFVILVPADRRAEIGAAGERFDAWMAAEFPNYQFRVVEPEAEFASDLDMVSVAVVPILGSANEGFTSKPLARAPDNDVLAAIIDRVEAFGRSSAH